MRILLLGGVGYISSQLLLHLQKQFDVVTVDLEWFGNFVNLDNFKVDYRTLDSWYFKEFDAVILLAGHSSVQMCQNARLSSFKNNVVNFVELLGKIKKNQKFIYASSSSIYGNTENNAVAEDWSHYRPQNYYDLNKQEIDYYAQLSDIEFYGLRFGTVNGPSPNLRTDLMINKMYETALVGRVEIFNRHICRPILGIEDLCRAIEAIILGDDHRGIYNLASFNSTVGEIAENVCKFFDGKVSLVDKGTTPSYNFSINTDKFTSTYNFTFKETVETIVHALCQNWSAMQKSIRLGKEYA